MTHVLMTERAETGRAETDPVQPERDPAGAAPPDAARLTTFVVDDEALARQQVAAFVAEVPWATHLGEAPDGVAGLEAIHALRPDVLFLDIRMPELSGLDLAARLSYAPAIVFTTAHDRYAVTAFDLDAVDYLLKPFGRRRFVAALERARRALAARSAHPLAGPPVAETPERASLLGERLLLRDRGAIVPVALADVERIQADDDYVAVYARGRRHLVAARLGELAAQLPAERFLRVHRSHVVNLDFVERLVPFDPKRLEVRMRDGTRILASRASSEMIRRRAR